MERSALISDDGKYRYWLKRKWGEGKNVLWCMLNPSTADAEVDDPTVLRVIEFSQSWGFGSATVVNKYAIRSSDPSILAKLGHFEAEGPANGFHQWTEALSAHALIVAWGNPGGRGVPLPISEAALLVPYCLGITQSGCPIHPLARGKHRVAAGSLMVPYDQYQRMAA